MLLGLKPLPVRLHEAIGSSHCRVAVVGAIRAKVVG